MRKLEAKFQIFGLFLALLIFSALFFSPSATAFAYTEETVTAEVYASANPIELCFDYPVPTSGNLNESPSYDFVLSDGYVGLSFAVPEVYPDATTLSRFQISSTNHSVVSPVKISDSNKYALKLNGIGKAVVELRGALKYSNEISGETVEREAAISGYITINVTAERITSIRVLTEGENKIGETVTYTVILNENERLTDYTRNNIKWLKDGKQVATGNGFIVTLKNNERLSVSYKNQTAIGSENQSSDSEALTVMLENPDINFDTVDDLWWLWQLLLLGILVACSFILYKIKHTSSLERAQAVFKIAMEKLERIKFDENSRIKRKQLSIKINDAESYLTLAKRSCQRAIAEDELYELNPAIVDIEKVISKLNSVKRNIDRIDLTKLNGVMLKLTEMIMPSYTIIITAIETAIAKENAEKEERMKAIAEEKAEKKRQLQQGGKRLLRGCRKDIKNGAFSDTDHDEVASQTTPQNSGEDEDDLIGAIILTKNIDKTISTSDDKKGENKR